MKPSPHASLAHDPFLLPVCDCGGPMNLASLEPDPVRTDRELKTYKCRHCGKQQELSAPKRAAQRSPD